MLLITFDYFLIPSHISNDCFQLLTFLQMLEWGSFNGRRGRLQVQIREPIKSIRMASNFPNQPWQETAKENIVHIKNKQSNKINIIQQIAQTFLQKIFRCNPLGNH